MTGQNTANNVTLKDIINNSINNLKVNHSKFYESAKNNTLFALNMAQDGIISLAVVNLVFSIPSLLFSLGAGYVLYKTVKHGIAEFKRYSSEKEKIKKMK